MESPHDDAAAAAGGTALIVDPLGVVDTLRSLLRFDTTNRGVGDAEGEQEAAEWIAGQLSGAGWSPLVLPHPEDARRVNVVLRVRGQDPDLAALLVHGHLDVVPAEADEWSVPPFSGAVVDDCVWGRGAVDMKDTCAAMLAIARHWGRTGIRPRRDVVLAFVADEETDGRFGAEWLVDAHPDLFEGVEVAIGESGAVIEEHSDSTGQAVRLARISAGERGTLHLALTARGEPGHGSRPVPDHALGRLVGALHRLTTHRWPVHLADVVREQIQQTADALAVPVDLDSESGVEAAVAALGAAGDVVAYTVRASATPTLVRAGTKVNVVPSTASAEVDVRCPPGYVDELRARLPEIIGPGIEITPLTDGLPLEAPTNGPWWEAMSDALQEIDPAVVVVPGCMGGGTDAKAFARLGITCYGFAPATLDPGGRRRRGIHGIDERTPVASLIGGTDVLSRFLETV